MAELRSVWFVSHETGLQNKAASKRNRSIRNCYIGFTPYRVTVMQCSYCVCNAVASMVFTYICNAYSSHQGHRQDKTVLSCPCRRCELIWTHVKTVFSSPQYIWDWTVPNWKLGRDKTKLSCFVANSVHTADTDKTRQYCFVLSMSAVWNRH